MHLIYEKINTENIFLMNEFPLNNLNNSQFIKNHKLTFSKQLNLQKIFEILNYAFYTVNKNNDNL